MHLVDQDRACVNVRMLTRGYYARPPDLLQIRFIERLALDAHSSAPRRSVELRFGNDRRFQETSRRPSRLCPRLFNIQAANEPSSRRDAQQEMLRPRIGDRGDFGFSVAYCRIFRPVY